MCSTTSLYLKIKRIMLIALWFTLGYCVLSDGASAQNRSSSDQSGTDSSAGLWKDFNAAIENVSAWRSEDVKVLKPLIVDSEGMVEVVSVTPNDITSPLASERWVSVIPELQTACRLFQGGDYEMQVRQVLGLPPNYSIRYAVVMKAKESDVFRPTPDPNPFTRCPCGDTASGVCASDSVNQCGNSFPKDVPATYRKWFEDTRESARQMGFPWTHLGYTYNWKSGADRYGVSEYVVKEKADVKVVLKATLEDYCKPMTDVEASQNATLKHSLDGVLRDTSSRPSDRKTCRSYYLDHEGALSRAQNCEELGASVCGGPDQCSCKADERLVTWKCDEGTFNACSPKRDGQNHCP